jgi:hypothetical protein
LYEENVRKHRGQLRVEGGAANLRMAEIEGAKAPAVRGRDMVSKVQCLGPNKQSLMCEAFVVKSVGVVFAGSIRYVICLPTGSAGT